MSMIDSRPGSIEGATRDSGSPPPGPVAPVLKHTPGPWSVETIRTQIGHANKINPIGACIYVDHRDRLQKDLKTLTAKANANLIAAAPDLLDACKDAVTELYEFIDDCIEDPNESDYRIIRLIEAVIAKAEGRVANG